MTSRLQACQEALAVTLQMLHSARQGLWDALPDLQASRHSTLKVLEDPTEPVHAQEQECLQHILQAQTELQTLVQARRDELCGFLNARQLGRSMSRAYTTVVGHNSGL